MTLSSAVPYIYGQTPLFSTATEIQGAHLWRSLQEEKQPVLLSPIKKGHDI